MNDIFAQGQAWVEAFITWFGETFLSYQTLAQLGVILLLWGISLGIVRLITVLFPHGLDRFDFFQRLKSHLAPLYDLIIWVTLILMVKAVADQQQVPTLAFNIAASLIVAWIVIRSVTALIESREIARLVRNTAWTLAALNIVGWLGPLLDFLDGIKFSLGQEEISIIGLLIGALSLVFLVWAALMMTNFLEGWLKKVKGVNPSARVLLAKVARILLITFAFLFAVSSVGIDLTVFAVFGLFPRVFQRSPWQSLLKPL